MINKFFSENRAVYKVMQKNKGEPDMPLMTIQYMCFACWIPKATGTHSEHVILIVFPQQKWLFECTSVLHYMYSTCLVTLQLLEMKIVCE